MLHRTPKGPETGPKPPWENEVATLAGWPLAIGLYLSTKNLGGPKNRRGRSPLGRALDGSCGSKLRRHDGGAQEHARRRIARESACDCTRKGKSGLPITTTGRRLQGPLYLYPPPQSNTPPHNTPRAPFPAYTHLPFLYKRRMPYFNTFQSTSLLTTSSSKKSTGNWPQSVLRVRGLLGAHLWMTPCCHCAEAFLVREWSFSSLRPAPALRAR
jgi:hypothetical protein